MKRLAILLIVVFSLSPAAWSQGTGALPTGFVVAEGANFAALRDAGGTTVKMLADWSAIEPERSQFITKPLDEGIAAASKAGLGVVLILAYTPKWASPAEGADLTNPEIYRHEPTHKIADWERFVARMATRYKGTVKDWQVWTTLSLPLFRGTNREYVNLLRAARTQTKAVDPTSRIVLATAYGIDLVSIRQVLRDAPTAFDVVSLAPRGYTPDAILRPLGVIRDRLFAAHRKGVWIEWDLLSSGLRPTWPGQVLKVMAIARAVGVEQVFWVGEAAADTGAIRVFAKGVGVQPFVGYLLTPKGLVLLFGEYQTAAVAWATAGDGPLTLDADNAVVYTPTGGVRPRSGEGAQVTVDLSEDPLLITGVGAGTVAQGKSTLQSKGLPIPPSSTDFGRETEVSARLGAQNAERGLYNMRYRTRRNGALEIVQIDGADAVRTNAGKEIVFVYFHVDESFLYYVDGRVGVEIVVEVWGAKAAQQLGFNILYDSMTGYRFTPWQWVELKNGWITYTFRLTDANFSGTWGWDFAINAGGNRQDDLTVRSVTVRKIPVP